MGMQQSAQMVRPSIRRRIQIPILDKTSCRTGTKVWIPDLITRGKITVLVVLLTTWSATAEITLGCLLQAIRVEAWHTDTIRKMATVAAVPKHTFHRVTITVADIVAVVSIIIVTAADNAQQVSARLRDEEICPTTGFVSDSHVRTTLSGSGILPEPIFVDFAGSFGDVRLSLRSGGAIPVSP